MSYKKKLHRVKTNNTRIVADALLKNEAEYDFIRMNNKWQKILVVKNKNERADNGRNSSI